MKIRNHYVNTFINFIILVSILYAIFGYVIYKFNKDYISYTADTVRGTYQVDLTLHLARYRQHSGAVFFVSSSDKNIKPKEQEMGIRALFF